jgi:prepilin-type N-terminal cleavage/methylation domain-containing protein
VKTENKKGFTLVELLIVMTIIGLLAIIAIMALNPQMLTGKANDSRRKSDLNKIRTAFEEYFNDKGKYPSDDDLEDWNVSENCGKGVTEISKYLKNWPCDPKDQVYRIIIGDNWFKVVTNLENKKDRDIPDGWYEDVNYTKYSASFRRDQVNYGISSSNILWYEGESVPSSCGNIDRCLGGATKFECNDMKTRGCSSPNFCYRGDDCTEACSVSFCD